MNRAEYFNKWYSTRAIGLPSTAYGEAIEAFTAGWTARDAELNAANVDRAETPKTRYILEYRSEHGHIWRRVAFDTYAEALALSESLHPDISRQIDKEPK